MWLKLPDPVVARDEVGTILTVLFVLFSIISWVVKLVGQQNEPVAKPPTNPQPATPLRRRRPPADDLAEEIRRFQEENRRPGEDRAAPRRPRPQSGPEPTPLEARSAQPKPRTPPKQPASGPGSRSRNTPTEERPQPRRRATDQSRGEGEGGVLIPAEGGPADWLPRHEIVWTSDEPRPRPLAEERRRLNTLRPHDLGSGLSAHTRDFMRDRLSGQVNQDLKSSVADSVAEHLGSRSAAPVAHATEAETHPLLVSLQNPASLKQALILSLVLAPPPSRTRGRGGVAGGPLGR